MNEKRNTWEYGLKGKEGKVMKRERVDHERENSTAVSRREERTKTREAERETRASSSPISLKRVASIRDKK